MRKKAPQRQDVEELVENAKKLTNDSRFRTGIAVGAVITVAIAVFIFQNGDSTDLEYLWLDFNVPLWTGLLVSFLAGSLAAPLFVWSWRRHRRIKAERKEAEQRIKDAEKQLT